MKLYNGSKAQNPEAAKGRFHTHAPFACSIILAGSLISSVGIAHAKDGCASAIKTGSMTDTVRFNKKSVQMNSLLPDKGYLQITLPKKYVDSLANDAAKVPEANRADSIRAALGADILAGYDAVVANKKQFECVPLSSVPRSPASGMPSPAGADTKGQKPETRAASADSPATTIQKPAPATQKPRTIGLGTSDTNGYSFPKEMAPVPAGGVGSDEKPYTIKVPISAPGIDSGTTITKSDLPYSIDAVGRRLIRVEFVAARDSPPVSGKALLFRMAVMAAQMIRNDLPIESKDKVSSNNLERGLGSAISSAKSNSRIVSAYIRD